MAYLDNSDILSWKRLIQNLQNKTDEGVKQYNKAQNRAQLRNIQEGGVHKLRVDQQTHITAEHHDVVVSSNDMGIIVDIYDKKSDNIDTNTYWNDDVMESVKNIKEGTWSVPETPEQVKKLTNLLKNPLDAETALDELYDVFGDDELFDDLEVMKREEPETDVRHVVIRRLKDMNFIKEVRENAKPTKESLASTTDDLSALEDIVMSYWDRLDDDMKAELNKFWDEPRDTDEIKPFEAKKGLKEEMPETTKSNPLVTIWDRAESVDYDAQGILGHMHLSTAAHIHDFDEERTVDGKPTAKTLAMAGEGTRIKVSNEIWAKRGDGVYLEWSNNNPPLERMDEDKVFQVGNIEWDTEDSTGEGPEGLDLPKSLTVNVPDEHLSSYEDTEEFISDFISNVTGFTHKGFNTSPDI